MKIRIGYGLGTRTPTNDERFGPFVDDLERLGFDSLWVSERITGEAPDPVVAMAYAAGRTTKLKFGMSVMVLPGRNPVLVAKELASLDRLSGGRLLPAFGLGAPESAEHRAFAVKREERAALFDEALPLIRRLWAEDDVTHHGPRWSFESITVLPKPRQGHLDVWLGGMSPSELRRTARLADGWLPSFIRPAEAGAGRRTIEELAAGYGRAIDPEHYGVLIPYSDTTVPGPTLELLARRRPGVDPTEIIPMGFDALTAQIRRFIDEGISKFVLIPLAEPPSWEPHLAALADAVLPLQR
jgi:probable F420-dependent oxidoreductase